MLWEHYNWKSTIARLLGMLQTIGQINALKQFLKRVEKVLREVYFCMTGFQDKIQLQNWQGSVWA